MHVFPQSLEPTLTVVPWKNLQKISQILEYEIWVENSGNKISEDRLRVFAT